MAAFNSFAFSLLGLVMGFLPAFFPAHFPPTGIQDSNTSALWLEFMGAIQTSLGVFFYIRDTLLPFALRLVAWWVLPAPLAEQPQRAIILRPMAGYLPEADRTDRRMAA